MKKILLSIYTGVKTLRQLVLLLFLLIPFSFATAQLNGKLTNSFSITKHTKCPFLNYTYLTFKDSQDRMYAAGQYYINQSYVYLFNRLLADGTIDPSFACDQNLGYLIKVVPLNDGRLVTLGYLRDANNIQLPWVNILHSDGKLDHSFQCAALPSGWVLPVNNGSTIALQSNGKILVGATNYYNPSNPEKILIRLNSNGSIDNSFNLSGSGFSNSSGSMTNINKILTYSDNSLLVAGKFEKYNGESHPWLVKLNEDGSLDPTFNAAGTGPNDDVFEAILDSEGKIYIAGEFTEYNGIPCNKIARLNSDGSLDTGFKTIPGFGTDNYSYVNQLYILSNGEVLASGSFYSFDTESVRFIAFIKNDGTIDNSFKWESYFDTMNQLYSVCPTSVGTLIAQGNFDNNTHQIFSVGEAKVTGIDTGNENFFSVYSSADLLNIKTSSWNEELSYAIYTLKGELITEGKLSSANTAISLGRLNSQLLLVKIIGKEGLQCAKVWVNDLK